MHGYDVSDLGWRGLHHAKFRFDSLDPDAELDFSISPYAACHNNPVLKIDPNGRWVETAWDVFSLATGATSFVNNIKQGNINGAILDGVGVVFDAAATILPLVPAGAGAAIKAVRTSNKGEVFIKESSIAEKVNDGAKGIIYKVDGNKTPSGKPYVGSADDINIRAKTAKDGRDRNNVEKIGEYPKGNTFERRKAEQIGIDKTANEQGRKPNQKNIEVLDNKRNEISDKNRSKYGL